MPDGSEIIAVQGQRGGVYLWLPRKVITNGWNTHKRIIGLNNDE
jgi:hypothetical protein